jgi:acetyltransferase-like isoleucine patch superfamily enzyme
MAYLSREQILHCGFLSVGDNVLISDKASIYDPEHISIGENSRIDDFCVLAGNISIGHNVHITAFCNIAGGRAGVAIGDFATFAYGCHVIAQTDDYSGHTMTNSTVPAEYKNETSLHTVIGKFSILGAGSIVLPGAHIAEGVSAGAGSVFTKPTDPWTIYVGVPARAMKPRKRDLLLLAQEYQNDSI